MSVIFYKILHIFGALTVFISFGGMIVRSALAPENVYWRKLTSILNGMGLLLLLVGGFGLLAKLGYGFPLWALIKLTIWLFFGAATAIINRKPALGQRLWWAILLLGFLSVYLALAKPF